MSTATPPRVFDRRSHIIVRRILATGITAFLAATPRPAGAQASGRAAPPDVSLRASGDSGTEMRAFPGILLPGRTALLKSRNDGVLARVDVLVGSKVREGQLLVELVADEERVERDRAEVLLRKAEADRERARQLHSRGSASDESLEAAETAYDLAKADLDLARIRLDEHYIRAPFDGIVAERYVDPGTSIEAGDPLVRVTALSPLRLEVLLPETMLSAFSAPTVVRLNTAFPDTAIDVPVDLEAIVIDPASGTFPLQIEIENAAGRLVPGVSCTVFIPPTPRGAR